MMENKRFNYWFGWQFGIMLFCQEWNGGLEVTVALPFVSFSLVIGGDND